MPKFKCPYTYPHRSREKMAHYVAINCGEYWAGHHDGCFPLNYYVKADHVDLDFDHLWEKYAPEHMPAEVKDVVKNPEFAAAYEMVARREYDRIEQNTLWEWGQEGAWNSVTDSDTFGSLWSGGTYKCKFGLYGRSGGHLCVEEAVGFNLNKKPEDLYNELNDPEYTRIEDLRILYKLARQWEVDFTAKKASAEIEYQAAWQFFVNVVEGAWEEHRKEMQHHDEIVAMAKLVKSAIHPMMLPVVEGEFIALCGAAGVLEKELEG